ncbi:LysM domain-containing protein [Chloroflexota bacterium]
MKSIQSKQIQHTIMIVLSALIVMSFSAAAFAQPAAAVTCKFRHKVEAGETVSSIAALYGISWLDVVEANNLSEPYTLQIDERLCIPSGAQPSDTGDTEDGDSGGPSLEAILGFRSILVEVNNLAKNTQINLRVGNYPSNKLITIGSFKTDGNGHYKDYFSLPSYEYLQSRNVLVCIKNVWTDEIACDIFPNSGWQFYTPRCAGPR